MSKAGFRGKRFGLRSEFLCAIFLSSLSLSISVSAHADPAAPLSALAQMPVKEVTVFKDGHAFVLHEGTMPTDKDGNVLMDYLPTPVMGTFWPFSSDGSAKLNSVVASRRKVLVPRTSLTLKELLQGNPGADTQLSETRGNGVSSTQVIYDATIIGVPTRSSEELEATSPPNSGEKLPEVSDIVIVKTATGSTALPIGRIDTVTFKGAYQSKLAQEEFRNLLNLHLDWGGKSPSKDAAVGLMYLQNGLRWIPNYKVVIDGKGSAHVSMEATLVNELTDLNDVTCNFVIGVPTFKFKDTSDPISMQETLANLSPIFRERNRTANMLSNSIMSQVAAQSVDEEAGSSLPAGPELSGSEKAEDLFVFTVKHVRLKKGQRMVLPVYESDIKYQDIYTLDLPFSPPPDVMANFNSQQQAQVDSLAKAPTFMHKIRFVNKSDYPFTTAPALLLKDKTVLAQGMMTYTAPGASSDLALTNAINLKVKKTDKETSRSQNATTLGGYQYARVDLSGKINVTNYGTEAAQLEVKRNVLGKVGTADNGGVAEMVNVFEDPASHNEGYYPSWWGWYSWPSWWSHMNGVGRITWKYKLPAKESVDLGYTWSYYWR